MRGTRRPQDILLVGSSELVNLATKPVDLRFVHTDATQDKVLLGGVASRTRIV